MTETMRIATAELQIYEKDAAKRKLPVEAVINLAVRDQLKGSTDADQIEFKAVNEQYMEYIDEISENPPTTVDGFDNMLERLRFFGQFVTTEELHVIEPD